jgi:hypothetical protein
MAAGILPVNHMAEPNFGAAGAALMAALAAHRNTQSRAAGYTHPPSHPFAHAVGRPGEPTPVKRRRKPPGLLPASLPGAGMGMGAPANPLAGLY